MMHNNLGFPIHKRIKIDGLTAFSIHIQSLSSVVVLDHTTPKPTTKKFTWNLRDPSFLSSSPSNVKNLIFSPKINTHQDLRILFWKPSSGWQVFFPKWAQLSPPFQAMETASTLTGRSHDFTSFSMEFGVGVTFFACWRNSEGIKAEHMRRSIK